MKTTGFLMAAASVALLAGCAATVPIELTDARDAYARASEGPAARSAPVELHAAQTALNAAEKSYKDDADSYRARDLAYVAQRKAEMAEAQASINTGQASSSQSNSAFRQEQGEQLQERTRDLSEARTQLAISEQARQGSAEQLVVEQEARLDAEQRLTERNAQGQAPAPAAIPERETQPPYGQLTEASVDQRVTEQLARHDAERKSADQDRQIMEGSRDLSEARAQLAASEQARQGSAQAPAGTRDRETLLVYGQSTDATVDQRVAEQVARHDAERNSRELNQTKTALAVSEQAALATAAQLRDGQQALTEAETRDADQKAQLQTQSDDLTRARADLAVSEKATVEARAELAKLVASRVTERGEVFTLSGGVIFRSNEAVLMPGAERKLDQLVKALASTPDRMVLVEGYTDSQGSAEHNLDLSQRRADAVRSYLMRQGYDAGQVEARGIGEGSPIADNATSEGRANNRRVEIVLVNPGKP